MKLKKYSIVWFFVVPNILVALGVQYNVLDVTVWVSTLMKGDRHTVLSMLLLPTNATMVATWAFLAGSSVLALVVGAVAMVLGPIYEFVGMRYREEGWDDWLFSKNKQPLLYSVALGVYALVAGHLSSIVGQSSLHFAHVLNFWFWGPVVGVIYCGAAGVSLLLCVYEVAPSWSFRIKR